MRVRNQLQSHQKIKGSEHWIVIFTQTKEKDDGEYPNLSRSAADGSFTEEDR